ncbi:MAG: hypothetical protein ABIJ09_07745, partial [Pseudomonadota bacterium]
YCDPNSLLPSVQETIVLFQEPPYLFQDFVGKAIAFLKSSLVRDTGFIYDPKIALPCKWKCADESVFGVDLCLYAYTGHYPFDKGGLGGCFNSMTLPAAVHHSRTNIDFGGAHVGYCATVPEKFGCIVRPMREREPSADCGYLMGIMAPFKEVYDDACKSIFLFSPDGWQVLISIPNEYLQPSWSSHHIKLLVDIENLASGPVPYDVNKPFTHKIAGRSLFSASPRFLEALPEGKAGVFTSRDKTPIGGELTAEYFHIFDSRAELDGGVPTQRFLPYMKYILSSKLAPYPLKAAVTHANIEHNRLVDAVRAEGFRDDAFASFSGVFIDIYDPDVNAYVNLFQPVGVSIKAAGRTREVEFTSNEIHQIFDRLVPDKPVLDLAEVLGFARPVHVLERFRFPETPPPPSI